MIAPSLPRPFGSPCNDDVRGCTNRLDLAIK